MTTIEELTPDDFSQVAEWLSDPANNRWLTSDWRNREVTHVLVGLAVRNKKNRLFLVRADGRPCGLVALADIDPGDRTAMIWYLLGEKSLAGRGIVTQAVKHLAEAAFGDLGLSSLYAWLMADNLSSRRVLEKAGFREVGYIRRATCSAGQQVDRIYFDLTPDERS